MSLYFSRIFMLPLFFYSLTGTAETFMHPVTTSQLSYCEYSDTTCATSSHHTGIDYSRHGDHKVVASNSGIIVNIEKMHSRDHGMGNNVLIQHTLEDNSIVYSSYSHLFSILTSLTEGQLIMRGETIGQMGGSGYGKQNHYGIHLHFELKNSAVSGAPTNSASYWGYVPTNPDNYGYFDPNDFIGKKSIKPSQEKYAGVFDGAGSLVNPAQKCFGCNKDVALMHPHSGTGSTVVFQWLYDENSCKFLDLTASNDINVVIKSKGWSDHLTQKAFTTTLSKTPVSFNKSSDWTTFAVTSINSISDGNYITANCRTSSNIFNDGVKESVATDLVDVTFDYYWTGTGSIISNANREGYGVNFDIASTFTKHKSLTSFQWFASSKCKSIKITDGTTSSHNATVSVKTWAAKKFEDKCTSLPCDNLQNMPLDRYYIVKVKSKANEFNGQSIRAECN